MYFNFQNNKYNRTMALLVTGETQLVIDFFLVFWFDMPSLLYTRSPTHVSLSVDRKHSMDTYLVICGWVSTSTKFSQQCMRGTFSRIPASVHQFFNSFLYRCNKIRFRLRQRGKRSFGLDCSHGTVHSVYRFIWTLEFSLSCGCVLVAVNETTRTRETETESTLIETTPPGQSPNYRVKSSEKYALRSLCQRRRLA